MIVHGGAQVGFAARLELRPGPLDWMVWSRPQLGCRRQHTLRVEQPKRIGGKTIEGDRRGREGRAVAVLGMYPLLVMA